MDAEDALKYAGVLALILLLVLGARYALFHGIPYSEEEQSPFDLDNFSMQGPTPQDYRDAPGRGGGTIIVDASHLNHYHTDELDVLLDRIEARGAEIKVVGERESLRTQLSTADALIAPVPRERYSDEEVDAVETLVERGGRLLLLDDASRISEINSIARHFGLTFNHDYAYDQEHNDGNFKNVIYGDFEGENLTKGLDEVALYTAETIRGEPIFEPNNSTFSSVTDGTTFPPVAGKGTVVAIGDMTVLQPPNNAYHDNDRFISNLADFLTNTESNPADAEPTPEPTPVETETPGNASTRNGSSSLNGSSEPSK